MIYLSEDNTSLLFYYIQDKYIELKDNYIVQDIILYQVFVFLFQNRYRKETYNLYKGEKGQSKRI